jgi:hypothetical protein
MAIDVEIKRFLMKEFYNVDMLSRGHLFCKMGTCCARCMYLGCLTYDTLSAREGGR